MLVTCYWCLKENGGNASFIFVSKDWEEKDKLLILIHGSGVVRAGQWARRYELPVLAVSVTTIIGVISPLYLLYIPSLIINENMEKGTQIPYIKEAKSEGYAVLVMNTNDNRRNGRSIKVTMSSVYCLLLVSDKITLNIGYPCYYN